jgi:hypothetical protein
MKSSVVSYPHRGHYGNNLYRGNCTGHIIKDFINQYLSNPNGMVTDPSIGGLTFMDVCSELGVRHTGLDLHQGYNLLTTDLARTVGEESNLVWWHPPYWDIIQYSGDQWGQEANPWDMSRMDLDGFIESLYLSISNINDAVETGGHFGILMGNVRKNGVYYNLSSLIERISSSPLVDEVIKVQHNCVSDSRQYRGNLVRIAHEKLLVFRKSRPSLSLPNLVQLRFENQTRITWSVVVRRAVMMKGGKDVPLSDIYDVVEPYAEKTSNNHWKAKIRQVVQDTRYFARQELGVYSLIN